MIKKLIITLLLFIGFFGISFAGQLQDNYYLLKKELGDARSELQKAETSKKSAENNLKSLGDVISSAGGTATQKQSDNITKYEQQLNEAQTNINAFKPEIEGLVGPYEDSKEAYIESDESDNDFSTTGFKLNVNDVFPASKYSGELTMEGRANVFFADIIQKLMIGLGSVALLLMTIGAGFMIFYHGEDNLLTKGKSIFGAGIISLVIALFSFYMVEIVKYLIG